jgi:4-hydroxy-3-polyprenylbenzoate decarboxylase
MAYKNLQHFIKVLEDAGELVRIREYVNPKLEITEIADSIIETIRSRLAV